MREVVATEHCRCLPYLTPSPCCIALRRQGGRRRRRALRRGRSRLGRQPRRHDRREFPRPTLASISLPSIALTTHNAIPLPQSYDPEDDTWRPRGSVPANLVTSDLTAWAWKDYVYVAGGFVQDYTAVGTVYRFRTSKRTTDLAFEALTPSPHPRGDFHAVVHSGYAYLAGGITHTSVWCEALTTVERYDVEADAWEDLPPLAVGRADMAVAVLGGKVLAVGGESKPEDCAELADPAYGSFPTDHVAVLLNADAADPNDARWVDFEDFDDERFRFAAATVPELGRVYAFGGQMPFDFTCDCFPTSARVAYGVETFAALKKGAAEDDGTMRVGAIVGVAIAVAAAAIAMVALAVSLRKSK